MAAISWSYDGPALARAGYCVFALNYGKYRDTWGRAKVRVDATQVARYVARVRRATRARRVSLLTHSAGGAVARYYLRFLKGADVVRDLVSLAPPNHVTSLKHSCPLLCSH
jgi:triacylglycerol lipase